MGVRPGNRSRWRREPRTTSAWSTKAGRCMARSGIAGTTSRSTTVEPDVDPIPTRGGTGQPGVAALNGGLGGMVYGYETSVAATFDNIQVGTAAYPITDPVIAPAPPATGGAVATTTKPTGSPTVSTDPTRLVGRSYLLPEEPTAESLVDAALAEIENPTLPALPDQLIRVRFPVFGDVPCGGGCQGMAQPPPPRGPRRRSDRVPCRWARSGGRLAPRDLDPSPDARQSVADAAALARREPRGTARAGRELRGDVPHPPHLVDLVASP